MNHLLPILRSSILTYGQAVRFLWNSRRVSTKSEGIEKAKPFLSSRYQYSLHIPRFTARDHNYCHGQSNVEQIDRALKARGIALIDLEFSDPQSDFLLHTVLNLGKYQNHGPPIRHSSSRGWFWDVRPTDEDGHKARSEGSSEFPWHTDCSYEPCPPQYFGLHVLHADQSGGGTLSALHASSLLQRLSPSARISFSRPDFCITVPSEFFKGTDQIKGNVVKMSQDGSDFRIRYRSDITQGLSARAGEALGELNHLLAEGSDNKIQDIKIDFTSHDLPDNSIILMDNGRWLHSRTSIRDRKRHLRRIRWGRREF